MENQKPKLNIFKNWLFWVIFIFLFLYNLAIQKGIYGNLFFIEYLGVFITSFIFACFLYLIGVGISKVIEAITKKKK